MKLMTDTITSELGSSSLCPPSTSRSLSRAGDPPCHTPCKAPAHLIKSDKNIQVPEVALPAPGPDVGHLLLPQHPLDPVILRPGFDADGVHAELPAVVPGPLPVQLGVPARGQPGEVIRFAKSALVHNP